MFSGKRILHISHTDLDGYGSQLIFYTIFNEKLKEKEYHYKGINVDYGEDLMEFVDKYQDGYDVLIITDLNVDSDLLDKINEKNYEKIIYIDHHLRTDNEYLFDNIIRNKGKIEYLGSYSNCATYLTYEYIVNKFNIKDDNLFKIACLIDIYDMWKIEYKKDFLLSVSLSDSIYYLNDIYCEFKKTERFEKILKIFSMLFPYYIFNNKCGIEFIMKKIYGKPLYDKLRHISNDLVMFGEELSNYPVAKGLFQSLKKVNDLKGDDIINEKIFLMKNKKDILQYGYIKIIEKYNVKIIINVDEISNSDLSVSARSINGEAIKIIRKLGGGGHANACGAYIKNKNYNEFKKMLYEISE